MAVVEEILRGDVICPRVIGEVTIDSHMLQWSNQRILSAIYFGSVEERAIGWEVKRILSLKDKMQQVQQAQAKTERCLR